LKMCVATQAGWRKVVRGLIGIPVVLSLPAMIFAVPPLVVGAPATFALGVQLAPPVVGLAAMFAVVVNSFVQPRLRFFNRVLAVGPVVGMGSRRSYKYEKRERYCCHQQCVSNSSIQTCFLRE